MYVYRRFSQDAEHCTFNSQLIAINLWESQYSSSVAFSTIMMPCVQNPDSQGLEIQLFQSVRDRDQNNVCCERLLIRAINRIVITLADD